MNFKRELKKRLKSISYVISDEKFISQFSSVHKDEFIQICENRFKERFFFDSSKRDEIIDVFKKEYGAIVSKIIRQGDDYCEHIFDLLGSGRVRLGEQIDWHLDFKSGFRWNKNEKYLGTRKHVNLQDSSDVKVPWELSRCQHFVALGKAYWLTKNEKYAEEFVDEIDNWIDNNPGGLGVNWACTMDVAIRAVNWIWGFCFFMPSKTLTKEFKIKFLKSLYVHGRHIANNLEFGEIRGNHYLSDVVGLVYLGVFFQETKEGEKWLEKGLSALEDEMKFQVYPDGVDFEASINYHRLVTELFLSSVLLCKKNDIEISDFVWRQLEKMIEFVMYYTKTDGKCPLIGDVDNGRLHILSQNDFNDHRYLLSIGAVLFERADFKNAYNEFNEEAFWLLGIDGLNKFKNLPEQRQKIKSKSFKDGGYYVMRDDGLYMIIRCGDVGLKGRGCHGHCDCLSFELFAGDKTFIVDPGMYVYTASPQWRNRFRGTGYHNTIMIDGKEMNRFNDRELFSMKFDAIPQVNKWVTTDKYDFFDGEHNGYAKLENPVVHRRQIHFNKEKKYWIIKDILTGDGKHKFEWYFHFVPIELEQINEKSLMIRTRCNGTNITLDPIRAPNGLRCEIQDGWISQGYGKKVKASIVKYKLDKDLTGNDVIMEFKISLIE